MKLDRTTPPQVSPFSEIKLFPETVETLPNGITFHYIDVGEQPISRLGIYWEGGKLDSSNGIIASILSQAFREQTSAYTPEEVADIIDFNGARLSSRCADHYTALELLALNSKLPALLPLVKSIITEATFTEQNVGVVARKLAAAKAVQLSKVSYRADVEAHRLIQGDTHPASYDEKPDEYTAVRPEEVENLYRQMKDARMHIFLGGALGENTISIVRDFFSNIHSGIQSRIDIIPFCAEPICDRIHIEMPESQQSAVALICPTIDRTHPDYIPLRLAVQALGGYFGSRLMHNIREEKGLTYGISASLFGSREGAYMQISAQCDATHVEKLIEESLKEVRQLAINPPSGTELHRLRQHAWTQLAAGADSSFGILDYYITHLLVATPDDYFEAQLRAIDTLTPDRIAEMADKYLDPDEIRIVTSGV